MIATKYQTAMLETLVFLLLSFVVSFCLLGYLQVLHMRCSKVLKRGTGGGKDGKRKKHLFWMQNFRISSVSVSELLWELQAVLGLQLYRISGHGSATWLTKGKHKQENPDCVEETVR
jgi:hypothetical protein